MQPDLLKYILDLESVIEEIESVKSRTQNDFTIFQKDIILQRAIERDLEIIGEAIRKIITLNPSIEISASKKIIGLRNIIAHAYDSVNADLIWAIIQKDIPKLSQEIEKIKNS